jgi:hypothetical protein
MQRLATIAALPLLVCALAGQSSAGSAEPPVSVVEEFLVAVQSRNCERAWTYLSAASRYYIECKSKEMTRSAPYYADSFSARNLYCLPTSAHRYHSYKPRTARLKLLSRGRATVSIERHDSSGFLLPGFFPTTSKVVPVEMDLVEEAGR